MNNQGLVDLGNGSWYDPSDGSVFDAASNQWIYPAGQDASDLVVEAADSGWDIGTLSDNLLKVGYTAAQLAMLYQNVKSSARATPQVLDYLAKENVALQTNTGSTNTMWMLAGIGLIALVVLTQNNRQAA